VNADPFSRVLRDAEEYREEKQLQKDVGQTSSPKGGPTKKKTQLCSLQCADQRFCTQRLTLGQGELCSTGFATTGSTFERAGTGQPSGRKSWQKSRENSRARRTISLRGNSLLERALKNPNLAGLYSHTGLKKKGERLKQ